MKKRIFTLGAALMMLSCMGVQAQVNGTENATIQIDDSADLINAIKGQADGQIWILAPGTYDIRDNCRDMTISSSDGWSANTGLVFPIYVNNLTIKGEGDVTITSSYTATTGNWYDQNFITISGNSVTIDGVDLKGNPSSFENGVCNKVIELIGAANNFTLKNSTLLPLTDNEGKVSSGSIYFSTTNPGASTIENVTMYSWISARQVTGGQVEINNVTQDFTNNTYAGYADEQGQWLWNPGVSGSTSYIKMEGDGLIIKVDDNINLANQVFDDQLKPGTTIELTSDIYLDEKLNIGEAPNVSFFGIVLDGNGFTITASDDFKNNTTANPEQLVSVENSDITIRDITFKTTDKNTHALNLYGNTNVTLTGDVILDHTDAIKGAPLVVNGGKTTIEGNVSLITGEDSWYGANVDKRGEIEFEPNSSMEVSGANPILILVNDGTITDPENAGLEIATEGGTTIVKPEEPAVVVTYYDLNIMKSEGATLISRHGKDRVEAGGSFTLSLEIDEAYEGAEPTVYVKRGRSAEWQAIKIDEVSGFYQIRNVQTDIYVKVSGDGIWPVANETISKEDVRAYSQPNKIIVITPQPTDVQIISMAGAVVATDKVTGQREFANLAEGVYIVRMGETIVKLQVRN